MGGTVEADCHISNALKEFVAVAHHAAEAAAAFAAARAAPDQWHRDRAMERVFREVDAAEARLVALIETERGIRARCRKQLVAIDAFTADVHSWAATLPTRRAQVIRLDVATKKATTGPGPRRRAKNGVRVKKNLHRVGDGAPTAC